MGYIRFKLGYSTIDNAVYVERFSRTSSGEKRRKLYLGFVEFQKPFDSVSRSILWKVVRKLGFFARSDRVTTDEAFIADT